MTIVYVTDKHRQAVEETLDIDGPLRYESPVGFSVDHSATRVIVVGDWQKVREAYGGIVPVEVIEEPENEPTETND